MAEVNEALFVRELTVTHEHEGSKFSYTFKVPSPMDQARVGIVARNLRREDDPESGGSDQGLDDLTALLYYASATFVVLYKRGDNDWVMTPSEGGTPECDPRAWGPDAPVLEVFDAFTQELERFREERNSAQRPDLGSPVESEPDPE